MRVCADLDCQGLSLCTDPGGSSTHVAQWELSERLHISELCWGITSLPKVLLPGSAKEAKTYVTALCRQEGHPGRREGI